MNKREERRARLERRLEHLEARIRGGQYVGEDLSYDKGEASALKWILEEEWKYNDLKK